jgi:transposase
MSVGVEALFTSALGLRDPWFVESVGLDTAKGRIDFHVGCKAKRLACPECGAEHEPVHDRIRRSWRHLDFFQFEAWLHCDVPRVGCTSCGKTTQAGVPWAREGSGFTLAYEALALALCSEMPVLRASRLLRCRDNRLWRLVRHWVAKARAQETFEDVRVVGVDETSLRRGHDYVTVVHDLEARRLLFATPGRDGGTLVAFARDLLAHGGDPSSVRHICMDMSAAYLSGAALALPGALVSHDPYHVAALASQAMDTVRREERAQDAAGMRRVLGGGDPRLMRQLAWGMRRNPAGWSRSQTEAMHWLQRSNLRSARAWRLRMGLRDVYREAARHRDEEAAAASLKAWLSWATRSRLEPFRRLAQTLRAKFDAVVRGMMPDRNNAYVEAMNGLLQNVKRAARGFRTSDNFIAIAYLRMGRLENLPRNPIATAGT